MTDFITQYWLEVLFTSMTAVMGGLIRYLYIQFRAIKLGMQAQLRNSIIDQYNKYLDKGYMPIYALENVQAMYVQYHALGGNGTITHLVEELKELPTREGV